MQCFECEGTPQKEVSGFNMGNSRLRRIKRVLVANRGEIAVRIQRTLRELGIQSVAVYSEADASALHVQIADAAVCIGPAEARASYLNIAALVDAACATGADAVHPGYGFLSENADFARAVDQAGLTFIGPPPDAIEAMGNKVRARQIMIAAGVPVLQGTEHTADIMQLKRLAGGVGFPLIIKPSAGGGGKGMRIVQAETDFEAAAASAQRIALNSFGDDRIYLERYLPSAHHVEVQIVADATGQAIYLGERDCSTQRRYQKVIEESPSPVVDDSLRERMGKAAVSAAQAAGYCNAGTVEFVLDENGEFYFLEMNTRLQVEHPVTEWVAGVDLVALQVRLAEGEPLPFKQEQVFLRGHAIECRIYAEDPAQDFMPSGGRIFSLEEPRAPWTRVDSGIFVGWTVPMEYDPMLAKLSVWGPDRESARRRAIAALQDYAITGLKTNIGFLLSFLECDRFRAGRVTTTYVDEYVKGGAWIGGEDDRQIALAAAFAGMVATEKQVGVGALARDGGARRVGHDPWRDPGGWRLTGGR